MKLIIFGIFLITQSVSSEMQLYDIILNQDKKDIMFNGTIY